MTNVWANRLIGDEQEAADVIWQEADPALKGGYYLKEPRAKSTDQRVASMVQLLEALEHPHAFVVRLLNPGHSDYPDVEAFFSEVVRPIVEKELGYKLIVVDGAQQFDYARRDQAIFEKLHRSSVVIADITGARPNCFIELGYALGRRLPTMLTVKEGLAHPFDIYSVAGLHGKPLELWKSERKHFGTTGKLLRIALPLCRPIRLCGEDEE